MSHRVPSVSSRPFTLAERLALEEAEGSALAGPPPDGPRGRAAKARTGPGRRPETFASSAAASDDDVAALLERSFAALEFALEDPERERAAQERAARRAPEDRLPLRAGLLLRAHAILQRTMAAVRAEVARRIALRGAEVERALLAADDALGPFLPRPEQARLEAFAAGAPSLPSMRGVPGDHEPDPPDPWQPVPEPDPYDEYRDAAEHAVGIADARRVLALAEDGPLVRAALIRWAEGEGLLEGTTAEDFLASDAQVRGHLDGFRFDLERLAVLRDRRDVAFGSVATQLAWGRGARVLGPRSAELILERLRIPANHSGT